jgi:hypothetical protein
MITRVQYLRLSTVLPIIAPIPLLTVLVTAEIFGLKLPGWVDFAVGMSFSAVLMFGIPYCILIGVFLLFLWERSWKAHVIAALVAPVLMIPVVGVFLWAALRGNDAFASAVEFAPYCLGVGYTYVGAAPVGMWALIAGNRVKDEETV